MSVEFEVAVELIKANSKNNAESENISIDLLRGRVLKNDIHAVMNQPPFDRSPLDGYAINSEDVKGACSENPITLKVIDCIYAGGYSETEHIKGTAIRIMTGAPIPKGYDCIIRQEDTDYGENEVKIYTQINHHQNYCFAGEDVKMGSKLIEAKSKLNAMHIAVLASQGISSAEVYTIPKVLLITTGDELIEINEPLSTGKIYNSNLYLLKHRISELGFDVTAKMWEDDGKTLAEFISTYHAQYHAIITTGGVSVGVKDIIHDVYKELKITPIFKGVEMKPGTPAMFCKYYNTPMLNLSGNPFAAFATFELLGRAMLAQISADSGTAPKRKCGIVKEVFPKHSPTRRFVRAFSEGDEIYFTAKNHSSGAFSDTVKSNCLVDIPLGNKGLNIDDKIEFILY